VNLAVDLDGVLAVWKKPDGYHEMGDEDPRWRFGVGEWVEGARDALRQLMEGGHRVVVHTCRATWPDGGEWPAVADFLESGGFSLALVDTDDSQMVRWEPLVRGAGGWERARAGEADGLVGIWIGRGKPIAHVYLDDRALLFDAEAGGWPRVLGVIRELEEGRPSV
jgi:hypothetical protein